MTKVMRRAVILFPLIGALAGYLLVMAISGRGYRKFEMGNTSSMSPTISSGEVVSVKLFIPKRDRMKRWQIVLFWSPALPDHLSVMRVVGLPGEQVEVTTNAFLINGVEVPENEVPKVLRNQEWLTDRISEVSGQRQWVLGSSEVFVVGDNLGETLDSRIWGPLSLSNVIGVAEMKTTRKQK